MFATTLRLLAAIADGPKAVRLFLCDGAIALAGRERDRATKYFDKASLPSGTVMPSERALLTQRLAMARGLVVR